MKAVEVLHMVKLGDIALGRLGKEDAAYMLAEYLNSEGAGLLKPAAQAQQTSAPPQQGAGDQIKPR
jgi:hypothetical protein